MSSTMTLTVMSQYTVQLIIHSKKLLTSEDVREQSDRQYNDADSDVRSGQVGDEYVGETVHGASPAHSGYDQ